MKRMLALALATLLAAMCVIPASAASEKPSYTDIPGKGHWAYPGIQFVISEGWMVGTGQGKFSPKQRTSRAMLVMVLYRIAGSPDISSSTGIQYGPQDAWHKQAMDWAELAGVSSGYSETAYAPDDVLTREQAAVMLYNFVHSRGYSCTALSLSKSGCASLEDYPDVDQASDWAGPALKWCLHEGLLAGTRKGGVRLLDPKGIVTREQLATILYHFGRMVKWPGEGDPLGTGGARLTVWGLLDTPSYVLSEADAARLEELLKDGSWSRTEDFLEYPSAFALTLGDSEYLFYVRDGEWLECCGFFTHQEDGEIVYGGMSTGDPTVLQEIICICQHYTPE